MLENLDSMESYVGYERVRLLYPFVNKRLVEFCLAAPGDLKIYDGYMRALVRRGLEGILPPAIQWRTTKQPFSTDFPLRYNRQLPALRAWLATIAPDDPVAEIVNIPHLQALAQQEAMGNRGRDPGAYVALGVVPRAVALIHFLRLVGL
jgi:asparagine synthase (glutamine-hydrolysing)